MKIVVGIVTYNTPIQCLQKLTRDLRTEPGVETVVLCNSPDPVYRSSLSVLEGDVVLKFSENKGFGAGHNQIFGDTRPDWYVCCNPDIGYRAGVIPGLIEAAESVPRPGLVSPGVRDPETLRELPMRPYLSLKEVVVKNLFKKQIQKGSELAPGIFQIQFVSGCFFVVSKRVFEEVGGFDEKFFLYCEDADLSLRVGERYPNLQVSTIWVDHDGQHASRKSVRMAFYHISSLTRYIGKHRRFFG